MRILENFNKSKILVKNIFYPIYISTSNLKINQIERNVCHHQRNLTSKKVYKQAEINVKSEKNARISRKCYKS